jgi:hypothetical protein
MGPISRDRCDKHIGQNPRIKQKKQGETLTTVPGGDSASGMPRRAYKKCGSFLGGWTPRGFRQLALHANQSRQILT